VSRTTEVAGTIGPWTSFEYSQFEAALVWALLAIAVHLAVAAILLAATLLVFDRRLGRIPDRRILL
jgi:hypothetical protein